MNSEGAPSATRDSILDAAKRVMQREGAAHLTLDAVAKETGISKGGLLYHFPNKQALLRGMVAKGIGHQEEEMSAALGTNPARGAFSLGFLRHAMLESDAKECKPPMEMVWSMIGAAANDPTLLEPVREMHAHWQKRLEDDLGDRDVATLVRLVGHGLWSTELFGFDVPDLAQRERISAMLSRLAGLEEHMKEER